MKKKLFVVDTDKDFQNQVKTLCPPDQVEIFFYATSMEIFSLIGKEKPLLIFLNLDLPDLSDFVMHDLLKKTDNIPIPVLATYSDQSEKDLQQYKKLKFQAKGYYRKPLSNDELYGLLENYLELEEDGDEDFSDENIDRLVRGELVGENTEVEEPIKNKPGGSPEETKEHLDIQIDEEPELDELGADIFIEEPAEKKTGPLDNELQEQLIPLQKENRNLRNENKKQPDTLKSFQADLDKKNGTIRRLKSEINEKTTRRESTAEQLEQVMDLRKTKYHQRETENQEYKEILLQKIETLKEYAEKLENQNSELIKKLQSGEKEKSGIQFRLNELTNQLTDKERELVARNHEFEKSLKDKSDELEQLKEENEKNQSTLHQEMEKTTQMNYRLQEENIELKKREDI